MPRYIDADAFKQKLADRDIFFPALYKNELDEMPTADVVPRAELGDALLVCELTRDRVRELEAREGELAREILSEIREAYDKYGGAYGMLQKINELEQKFGVIDCTKCRYFVGCESCRTGQVCGEFKRIEN